MSLIVIIQFTVFLYLTAVALDTDTGKRTIKHRNKNQRQDGRYRETTNYRHTQRTPHLGTFTLCRERGMAVLHSVVTAGRSRLRPVLMTTLTTILGMVPMAVGQGEGAEMWRPLGVAVIGGLTVSTI